MSRGADQTETLRKNLQDQLQRLVQQLADLEDCKDELGEEEYQETKSDTMDQLREFQISLEKISHGDMGLVDPLGAMQLTIQAAISEAFKTPEVIRMFAARQPDQIRTKLAEVERDAKMGKMSKDAEETAKTEMLMALKRLGERLSIQEEAFLSSKAGKGVGNFEAIEQNSPDRAKVLEIASIETK